MSVVVDDIVSLSLERLVVIGPIRRARSSNELLSSSTTRAIKMLFPRKVQEAGEIIPKDDIRLFATCRPGQSGVVLSGAVQILIDD